MKLKLFKIINHVRIMRQGKVHLIIITEKFIERNNSILFHSNLGVLRTPMNYFYNKIIINFLKIPETFKRII
jgi:hypothetical protein